MDASLLTNLFHIGPDPQTTVSLLEKIIRPVVVYLFLVVGLRLAGKRELAQLNAFDLVVLMTLANAVQNAIIGSDNSLLGGLVGGATLLAFNYLVVRFIIRHPFAERALEGSPDKLVHRGSVLRKRLDAEGMTLADLEVAARKQGIGSLKEVAEATLEPSGAVTFVAKQPLPEEARHEDLVKRLDEIQREVRALAARLEARPS